MRITFIALAIAMPMAAINAQTLQSVTNNYKQKATSIVSSFRNSLSSANTNTSSADTTQATISPYMFPITSPGVYYSAPVADKLNLASDNGENATSSPGIDYRDALAANVGAILTSTYVNSPSLIHYNESQIAEEVVVIPTVITQAKTEDLKTILDGKNEINDVADVVGDVQIDLKVDKPNFWTTSGSFSLQFTQNYFSQNWYKGGNNNVTLLANLVLEANYNDQRKIQWDNKLDLRLGFMTAASDSCHSFLTSNDKIALYSKLGVKAAKYWNYTLSLEANTQFMPGYKSNDRRKYSGFLSPLDLFVSIGMDFKPQFSNKNTLSVALLPLSYKMRLINAEDETIHKAYNMVDKSFQQDFGSKIECNAKVQIVKDLYWRCRFYYFTSYKYAESELENAFSFQFNKYISTEVYTLWRFDDNRSPQYKDSSLGYFQFKEYFTLGLAYRF